MDVALPQQLPRLYLDQLSNHKRATQLPQVELFSSHGDILFHPHTFLHTQINPFRVRRSSQWQCRNAVQPPASGSTPPHCRTPAPPHPTALLPERGSNLTEPVECDETSVQLVVTPERRVASRCGNRGSGAYPRLCHVASFCRNFGRGGNIGRAPLFRVLLETRLTVYLVDKLLVAVAVRRELDVSEPGPSVWCLSVLCIG
jgi:hypothetical protein